MLVVLTMWAVIIATALLLQDVLLPFVLATLLAYVLHPAVSKICSVHIRGKTIPRGAAVISLYLVVFGVLYLFATLFLPELYRELVRLTKIITETANGLDEQKIHDFARQIANFLGQYNLPIDIVDSSEPVPAVVDNGHHAALLSIDPMQILRNLISDTASFARGQSTHIMAKVQSIVTRIVSFVFHTCLVFMLAAFILVDTDRIKRFLDKLNPFATKEAFDGFLDKVDHGLSGVVRGQLLICVINAMLTLTGLLLLQIKFALILATLAGLFSLVPIFGSIISTIPIALVALLNSPLTGLLAVLWVVGIHFVEANLLNPKIMGSSAKIHPVLVVLALVTGEHFYGIAGALLAVPIASILLTIFQSLLAKVQEA